MVSTGNLTTGSHQSIQPTSESTNAPGHNVSVNSDQSG